MKVVTCGKQHGFFVFLMDVGQGQQWWHVEQPWLAAYVSAFSDQSEAMAKAALYRSWMLMCHYGWHVVGGTPQYSFHPGIRTVRSRYTMCNSWAVCFSHSFTRERSIVVFLSWQAHHHSASPIHLLRITVQLWWVTFCCVDKQMQLIMAALHIAVDRLKLCLWGTHKSYDPNHHLTPLL